MSVKWSADFDSSGIVSGANAGTDALERLKKAAEEVHAANKKAEAFPAGASKKGGTPSPSRTTKSDGVSFGGTFKSIFGGLFGGGGKKVAAKAGSAVSAAGSKASALALAGAGAAGAALVGSLGVAGGVMDLAKIIAGQKAMMQLSAITTRAQLNFKKLFVGVDAGPILRAADRLLFNFSAQSVMGKTVGKVLTDAFNLVARAIEKIEPVATGAMRGIVFGVSLVELGLLKLESLWLDARLALKPYVGDIGDLVNKSTAVKVAFYTMAGAVGLFAVSIGLAALPFVAFGAALYGIVLIGQKVYGFFAAFAASPLASAIGNAFSSAFDVVKGAISSAMSAVGSAIDSVIGKVKAIGATLSELPIIGTVVKAIGSGAGEVAAGVSKMASSVGPSVSNAATAADKAASSAIGSFVQSGGSWGDGLISGIDQREGAIYEAGMRATKAAIKGAKAGAEIRSPSRVMRREVGRQLGEGTALGIEDKETRIEKAASSSLVPNGSILGALGKGGGKGNITISAPLISVVIERFGGSDEEEARMRTFFNGEARRIGEELGLATT